MIANLNSLIGIKGTSDGNYVLDSNYKFIDSYKGTKLVTFKELANYLKYLDTINLENTKILNDTVQLGSLDRYDIATRNAELLAYKGRYVQAYGNVVDGKRVAVVDIHRVRRYPRDRPEYTLVYIDNTIWCLDVSLQYRESANTKDGLRRLLGYFELISSLKDYDFIYRLLIYRFILRDGVDYEDDLSRHSKLRLIPMLEFNEDKYGVLRKTDTQYTIVKYTDDIHYGVANRLLESKYTRRYTRNDIRVCLDVLDGSVYVLT